MQKWTNSILRIVTTVVVTSLVVAPLSYATAGKTFAQRTTL